MLGSTTAPVLCSNGLFLVRRSNGVVAPIARPTTRSPGSRLRSPISGCKNSVFVTSAIDEVRQSPGSTRQVTRAGTDLRLTSRGSHGGLVTSVRHSEEDGGVEITVEVSECPSDAVVDVLWCVILYVCAWPVSLVVTYVCCCCRGMYRASPDVWQFPKTVEAEDTEMDDAVYAMRTAMGKGKKKGVQHHVAKFCVPQTLCPSTFAYAIGVQTNDGDQYTIVPINRDHFSIPIGVDPGVAGKLGPSTIQCGDGRSLTNFAVESRGGDYVSLVLVLKADDGGFKMQEIALDGTVNRTGAIWHAAIVCEDTCVGYGWRVSGDIGWEKGYRVSPDAVLLDPEAPEAVYLDPCDSLDGFPVVKTRDGVDKLVLSSVRDPQVDTTLSTLNKDFKGCGMLSLDPKTFGFDVEGVEHPGTFQGVSEATQYFVHLGIDTVVLSQPYTVDGGSNRSITYFAPDPSLAATDNVLEEIRGMVSCLHDVGIRVMMTVDLTLTAEGSDENPKNISWRGLDHVNYYRANGVINCGNPVAQEHIVRALRHWAVKLGMDGFEFLYAENMVQNMDEVVMDAPALPDALCHDPILSGSTMIASPYNDQMLPRQGERGFPHWGRWKEKNGNTSAIFNYFISPREFLNSQILRDVAAAIAGRPHLFSPAFHGFPGNLSTRRPIEYSIHGIDGSNFSSNESKIAAAASSARAMMIAHGHESSIPTVGSLERSMIASAIFSSGRACIPKESITNDETKEFVSQCLTCRPILSDVLDSSSVGTWLSAGGHTVSLDSETFDNFFLGRFISGHSGNIYVAMNPESGPVNLTLPQTASQWLLIVDSYSAKVFSSGAAVETPSYTLPAKSFALFMSQ